MMVSFKLASSMLLFESVFMLFKGADEARGIALRSYVIDLPVAAVGRNSRSSFYTVL
jgi:hypothetical protein